MKVIKKILLLILIVYLFISSTYILFHINFGTEPKVTGMGFSNFNNLIRVFMGIPKTYTTYEGVSPWFLIEVILKVIIAILLIKVFKKINKSYQ